MPTNKPPVKKTSKKKTPVKKTPVKKTPVKKTPVKKTPVKKKLDFKPEVVPEVVPGVVPEVKCVVKCVVEPVVECVVEPVVECVVEPVVECVVKPVVECVVKPVVECVVQPVVEQNVVIPPTVVSNSESECSKLKNQLIEMLTFANSIGDMSFNDLKKNLQKDLIRLTKLAMLQCNKVEKENNKFTKKKTKRLQTHGTGFEKKVLISPEFKTFILKHCNGTIGDDNLLSRKEGSNYIHTYIKGNNIQKPECKRHLQPNKALQSILGELTKDVNAKTGKKDCDVGYTYFNLQKYIKGCYISSV